LRVLVGPGGEVNPLSLPPGFHSGGIMSGKISFYSQVVRIEKHSDKVYDSGVGENAIFHEVDRGYFMLMDGSHEAIHIGFGEPMFKVGDKVKITIQRV